MAKREGIWFLAEFDGNRAVLCKVKAGKDKKVTDVKNEVLNYKGKLEVEISYDFFSPLRPIPMGKGPDGQMMMGIGRESVITGNHFVLEPCPCFINMSLATKTTFIDDMQAFDQAKYTDFIEQAATNLEAMRRAQSPIAQGVGGAMPNVPGLTMKMDPDGIPHATLDMRGLRGG